MDLVNVIDDGNHNHRGKRNPLVTAHIVEEKSRILRDAFVKVEKHQIQKKAHLIKKLNSTVLVEPLSYVCPLSIFRFPAVLMLRRGNNLPTLAINHDSSRITKHAHRPADTNPGDMATPTHR